MKFLVRGFIMHGESIDPFIFGFTVLLLACFVGCPVIWGVSSVFHSPLMSATNAIHVLKEATR